MFTEGFRYLKEKGATDDVQEQCTSACASAVCKHVQAYVHARPDWDQGILEQALDYVGAVPLPMLALITPNKVSSWASESCSPKLQDASALAKGLRQ